MKNININVRMKDGSPRLGCVDDNKTIGAMWDNRAQKLVFIRDPVFANYDMMLHFSVDGEWTEINIGRGNAYELTNAHTKSGEVKFRLSFWEGVNFRYGSVNTLNFKFQASPQNGSIPEEEVSQYLALLGEVSDLESRVDSVNEDLENLFPGGTNILRNTNTSIALASTGDWPEGSWRKGGAATGTTVEKIAVSGLPNPDITWGWRLTKTANASGDLTFFQSQVPLVANREYTISLYARAVSGENELTINLGPSESYASARVFAGADWTRITATLIPRGAGFVTLRIRGVLGASTMEIAGEKLEVGNKATDWFPGPWDISSDLAKKETKGYITMLDGASIDLNTLNTTASCGWYVAGGGNSAINKPSGVDAYGLQVIKVAGGYVRQILYQGSVATPRFYHRTYGGTVWSAWFEMPNNALTAGTATNSEYVKSGTLTYRIRDGVCSLYFQGAIFWENLPTTDTFNTLFTGLPAPENSRQTCDIQVYKSTNVDVSSQMLQIYSGILVAHNIGGRWSGQITSNETVYISCTYLCK